MPSSRILKLSLLGAAVAMVLMGAWAVGFINFSNAIGDNFKETRYANDLDLHNVDAIVVLTGGALRVNRGLDLLATGRAGYLFITGVNKQVELPDIIALWQRPIIDDGLGLFSCCIVLDHHAENTAENALETKKWAEATGVKSLLLVTSDYHMPRALLEFRETLPDIDIMPYPVSNRDAPEYPAYLTGLSFEEYNKTILTWIKFNILPAGLREIIQL